MKSDDRYKLINGDCLEVMKNIPDKSIDMILCDLPYGTTACKWDTIIPFEPLWEQYNRVIKDNGAITLTASQPFTTMLIGSNLKGFKGCWYWDKVKPSGFQIAKYKPMQRIEEICIFTKNGNKVNYYPIMTKREKIKRSRAYSQSLSNNIGTVDNVVREYSEKYPQNLLVFSNAVQKGKMHPTQKPVALLEYLIKTYTNEGMLVLDNCMGSGSTGVACLNTNRRFIGIELDENYYNIAKERIEKQVTIPNGGK